MRGKKELFMLILGTVLFIADLATDTYVAVQYGREGEFFWCSLTVVLIIIPLFIVNIVAGVQNKGRQFCISVCCDRLDARTLCYLVSCWPIIVRFKKEFVNWKRIYHDYIPCQEDYKYCTCAGCKQYCELVNESNMSAYKLAWIRYGETAIESAPQWCFQVYVMFNRWSFPWYAVLSTVIALLSLAWSVTGLEKARVIKTGHKFTWKAHALYFISQLFVLTSRLFAITTIAYASSNYLIAFVGLDCVLFTFLAFVCSTFKAFFCYNKPWCHSSSPGIMFRNIMLSIPLAFFVSDSVLESLGLSLFIQSCVFVIKFFENFLLVFTTPCYTESSDPLASYRREYNVTKDYCDETHFDILRPTAWSLVGTGCLVGIISLTVRWLLDWRDAPAVPGSDVPDSAVPDTNTTEAQTIAYHIPKSGTISATNNAFEMYY